MEKLVKEGATLTFLSPEGNVDTIFVEPVALPDSKARRWWTEYVNAEKEEESCWRKKVKEVHYSKKVTNGWKTALEKSLSKNHLQGRGLTYPQAVEDDLVVLSTAASGSAGGLHYTTLISLFQFLCARHKFICPPNIAYDKAWAVSWLRRRNFVLREKTQSTKKDVEDGVVQEHLLRGAYLVADLDIRPREVI